MGRRRQRAPCKVGYTPEDIEAMLGWPAGTLAKAQRELMNGATLKVEEWMKHIPKLKAWGNSKPRE